MKTMLFVLSLIGIASESAARADEFLTDGPDRFWSEAKADAASAVPDNVPISKACKAAYGDSSFGESICIIGSLRRRRAEVAIEVIVADICSKFTEMGRFKRCFSNALPQTPIPAGYPKLEPGSLQRP